MNNLLIYLFKVSAISGILYGIYRLFFHKTTFYSLNRYLLVFIMLFSLLCPVLEFGKTINYELTNYRLWIEGFQEFPLIEPETALKKPMSLDFSFSNIMLLVYILGLLFFLSRFANQFMFLFRLKKKSVRVQQKKFSFYLTDYYNAPFSFFNWIFLPDWYQNQNRDDSIMEHEIVHYKQLHSVDLILTELYCIAFWFNPFVFLLKRSLRTIHEYIADSEVIRRKSSPTDYLKLLLTSTEQSCLSGITNQFKSITIKNRIEMITKNKTSRFRKFSYLLLIPVMAFLLQAFSGNSASVGNVPDIVPVKQKDPVKITSGYGMRTHPITGELKMHNGIDIAAKEGTPVVATADGIVVQEEYKEKGKGYGRMILIRHNETYTTMYTQLSAFNAKVEQKVKKGDVIGYVGQSGISTGPHLHYEVWKNNKPVDPEDYFKN
jgi:hypothetical protein